MTAPSLEAHRALARELHLGAQRAYTVGGLLALGAAASVLLVAAAFGQLATPLPYLLAITLLLVTLFFANRFIKRRISTLRQKLTLYCQSNQIEVADFLLYFTERDYPFLSALLPREEPRR